MRTTGALLVLCLLTASAPAQEDDKKALERGLRYVSKNLKKIGSQPIIKIAERMSAPYNNTACMIAGIAYLNAGSKYKSDVRYCLDRAKAYLKDVEKQQMNISNWPVALAGLFCAEAHLRKSNKSAVKSLMKKIVRILEKAQKPDGGWGHQPVGKPLRHNVWGYYPETLSSTTGLAAASLGVMKSRADTPVKDAVLKAALDHLRTVQREDGGIGYDKTRLKWGSEAGRTAGAVFAFTALAEAGHDSAEVSKKASAYMESHMDDIPEGHGSSAYHMLLAAFALQLQGEDYSSRVRDRILKNQKPDGSFDCICSGKSEMTCLQKRQDKMVAKSKSDAEREIHLLQGRVYVTAIYCLLLQMGREPLKITSKPEK